MAARLVLGIEALALGAVQGGASFCAFHPRSPSPESDRVLAQALGAAEASVAHVRDAAEAASAVVDAAADGALGVVVAAEADVPCVLAQVDRAVRAGAGGLFVILGSRTGPDGVERASQAELASLRPRMGSPVEVLVPASAGECLRLASDAARASRERRAPVVLYVDHVVAHTREPVEEESALPAQPPGDQGGAELFRARDASILAVAAGAAARSARTAVRIARERGIRAGLLRLVRVWPFPRESLIAASLRARSVLMVELNEGQLREPVSASLDEIPRRPMSGSLAEPDSGRIAPERVLAAIEARARE